VACSPRILSAIALPRVGKTYLLPSRNNTLSMEGLHFQRPVPVGRTKVEVERMLTDLFIRVQLGIHFFGIITSITPI
jgi:hypothetical protein